MVIFSMNKATKNRVPTSLVTYNVKYFLGYFQVKAMKSQVNLASNHSVHVDNLDIYIT